MSVAPVSSRSLRAAPVSVLVSSGRAMKAGNVFFTDFHLPPQRVVVDYLCLRNGLYLTCGHGDIAAVHLMGDAGTVVSTIPAHMLKRASHELVPLRFSSTPVNLPITTAHRSVISIRVVTYRVLPMSLVVDGHRLPEYCDDTNAYRTANYNMAVDLCSSDKFPAATYVRISNGVLTWDNGQPFEFPRQFPSMSLSAAAERPSSRAPEQRPSWERQRDRPPASAPRLEAAALASLVQRLTPQPEERADEQYDPERPCTPDHPPPPDDGAGAEWAALPTSAIH